MSLIFVFIDGVGLAPAGPDNPLTDADTPALRALLGGPLTIERASAPHPPAPLRLRSGQASPTQRGGEQLLPCPPSWENGIGDGGRRPMLFKAIDATLGVMGLPQSGTGQTALLAGVNAAALHGRHQPHVPPVALRPLLAERSILRRVIERGGLRFRDGDDLRNGRAVSWDVTNAAMRARDIEAPLVTSAQAGARLAQL